MLKLSSCIFTWDSDHLAALHQAKSAQLSHVGVLALSETDVTHKELALHCRRATRGVEETTKLPQQLIACFDSEEGKDTMGVPLLDHERIQRTWDQQQ